MYIKLTQGSNKVYLSEIPTIEARTYYKWRYDGKYDKDSEVDFYYFQIGQLFSYSNFNYKFNSLADVEKLVEDIIISAANNVAIYDIDAELVELGITLK